MSEHTPMAASPVEQGARTAARRLAPKYGPRLEYDVEAVLYTRNANRQPDQYLDPISLGSLIVSVATLAWTVYKDLRKTTPQPAREVIARRVRVELPTTTEPQPADREQIIDIVVDEIIKHADT
jgi:hypothetical protein